MSNTLLSICVPTYNRSKELNRLINSIDYVESIDLIICDDGSTDDTKCIVDQYTSKVPITYIYQENRGRGFALKKSIEIAEGKYVIVMDSDDYFIPNSLSEICNIIVAQQAYQSFVFGIKIYKNNKYIDNIPPDIETNYISLRGDCNIKNDLKEVVRKDVIALCLYPEALSCRRVPTFLIWSCVAEKVNCLSVSIPVAVKEYLPGGMTDKGFLLRMECAMPMVELYSRLSHSTCYKSNYYRWKARVLWARYALHTKKVKFKSLWMRVVLLPGFVLYIIDKLILLKLLYRKKDG